MRGLAPLAAMASRHRGGTELFIAQGRRRLLVAVVCVPDPLSGVDVVSVGIPILVHIVAGVVAVGPHQDSAISVDSALFVAEIAWVVSAPARRNIFARSDRVVGIGRISRVLVVLIAPANFRAI